MVDKDVNEKTFTVEEVESVFDKKMQEAESQKKIQKEQEDLKVFLKDIEDKVEALEKANAEYTETIEALHEAISQKEADLEKAGEEITKLQQERDVALGSLATAEKKMAEAAEKELLSNRVQILAEKDLLRANEADRIKQVSRIKEMSDDAFNEYVEELEDIKSTTLAASKSDSNEEVSSEEETGSEEELEKVVEQLAEEVSKEAATEEESTAAANLIKDILAQVTKKTQNEKATAKSEDTDEAHSGSKGSPNNFESASVYRPTGSVGTNKFAGLSALCRK